MVEISYTTGILIGVGLFVFLDLILHLVWHGIMIFFKRKKVKKEEIPQPIKEIKRISKAVEEDSDYIQCPGCGINIRSNKIMCNKCWEESR